MRTTTLRVKRVKPHEIPLHLLRQKKTWDLRVFYEYSLLAGDNWCAFVLDEGDDGDPFAAVILADVLLSDCVEVHTLIVDKARRDTEHVAAAALFARSAALAFARHQGRKYAAAGLKQPQKFMDIFGHPPTMEIVETVIREAV
jgi:hypothetical protein